MKKLQKPICKNHDCKTTKPSATSSKPSPERTNPEKKPKLNGLDPAGQILQIPEPGSPTTTANRIHRSTHDLNQTQRQKPPHRRTQMNPSSTHFFPANWLRNSVQSTLFRSEKEWTALTEARKSAHFMRRAWDKLGLEAILTVENKPTVYFKRVTRNNPEAEAELQRLLWNQGTATLLVVRDDDKEVRVYSAMAPPSTRPITTTMDDHRLVETLQQVESALCLEDLIRRVETGRLYQEHQTRFLADTAVDRTLLRNLKAASRLLCSGNDPLKPSVAHALLGRLLFTCHLHARGVLSEAYLRHEAGLAQHCTINGKPLALQQILASGTLTEAKETLFRIFTTVQRDFNGSLFDEELEGEKNAIKDGHANVLRRFLNGDPLDEDSQLSLGFSIYDFSLIPIETISAIYESFLHNENLDRQNQTGSFYTPRHLAELTVDLATEGWTTLLDKRCLDPSCGSGIFLVILFNRMAEEWRARNPRAEKLSRAQALRKLLCDNLWGVDLNATACRITCFSLYLAFFDQLEPPDIWELKKELEQKGTRVLPPLLATPENDFKGTTPRILADNFFTKSLPLPTDFHLVIGNPPWIGRSQKPDPTMEKWLDSIDNPYLASGPKRKTERTAYLLPARQSAHGFLWKVPSHMHPDGRACLILPTKAWVNEMTNVFQAGWLRQFTLDHVIQLADYRLIIFEEANCPSIIARFLPTAPKPGALVRYDAPKVDRSDPRHAFITVLPEDQKAIRLADLLEAANQKRAAVLWKEALWGTGRDLALLHRLYQLPTLGHLAGKPDDTSKRWIKGQGFQPFSEKKFKEDPDRYLKHVRPDTKPWWTDGQRFMDAKSNQLNLVVVPDDAPPSDIVPPRIRRNPNQKIFQPPMVLITQGFGKAAFCGFPVIFQDSLQSIAARNSEDANLLRFLAGVLTSSFAKYFLFHTAANWGSERDKVHLSELLRLPFPLPENSGNPKRADEIVAEVAQHIRAAQEKAAASPHNFTARQNDIAAVKTTIEPLIFEYYGLSPTEQLLIMDTVDLFIPSSTPSSIGKEIPTLTDSTIEERSAYASQLCQTINNWGRGKGLMLNAHGHTSNRLGLVLLQLSKGPIASPYIETEAAKEVTQTIAVIEAHLSIKHHKLAYSRGFTLFEANQACVLKPLARRHWTHTAALNDADSILARFLTH